jgi:hypothetical protein
MASIDNYKCKSHSFFFFQAALVIQFGYYQRFSQHQVNGLSGQHKIMLLMLLEINSLSGAYLKSNNDFLLSDGRRELTYSQFLGRVL